VVPAASVSTVVVRLAAPAADAAGIHPVTLTLKALDAPAIQVHESTRFIGPVT